MLNDFLKLRQTSLYIKTKIFKILLDCFSGGSREAWATVRQDSNKFEGNGNL